MDETIDFKKEKVIEYIKTHPQLFVYLLLALVVLTGFTARLANLDLLKDITTGQYISLELDSEIFLRYAEYIAEHGTLYKIDPMRYYPLGGDISSLAVGQSYFVAYLYKFLHFFNSNVTIGYADLLSSPLSMLIMCVFLFLLLKRMFNWKVGLLAVTMIQFIPSFLFRSLSTDHDILAMMFIIMAFYFFIASQQTENLRKKVIMAVLGGISTVFSQETGGSSAFILLVIGSFTIVEIILNKLKKGDYLTFSIFLGTLMVHIIIWDGIKTFLSIASSLMGMIPYVALIAGGINILIFEKNLLNIKQKLEKVNLPEGIISLIITAILGVIIFVSIFGFNFLINKLSELTSILFHAYSNTRWTLTVAENQRPYVQDWFGQFGKSIIISMILGSILLFYRAVKTIDKKRHLTISYAIFIFVYIFSRYSGSSIFNGETTISRLSFYGSFVGFAIIVGYSYLKTFYKNKDIYAEIANIDKKYAFILIWFILMIVAATSAIRLIFEFTPVAVILSAYFFIEMFEYFKTNNKAYLKYIILILTGLIMFFYDLTSLSIALGITTIAVYFYDESKQTKPFINYLGILVMTLILFSPFSLAYGSVYQDYMSATNSIKYMGPGYTQQWQVAGKWVRDNTNKDSTVFAHWWDYGYWVQSGFDRTTILDGGNFIGWWNYLMGRKVLTGQSEAEALPYLKTHSATHLLAIADDIGKYTAYSSIGSDEKYDRFSYFTIFSLNPQQTKETRNGTTLFYNGGFALDENLIFKGQLYPQGQAGIVAIKVPVSGIDTNPEPKQPVALLAFQNNVQEITLKCIYFNNKLYEFENADYDGCLRIIPVIDTPTTMNPIGAGYLLSTRTYHSNFGQLYLLNKNSTVFKIKYDDSTNFPLALYQGRQIGPLKIWEINYPANFTLTEAEKEYNMRLTYPDDSLFKPR